MDITYKKILPADVYTSILNIDQDNLPSGNNFIDLFAGLVRKHGNMPLKRYASMMGIELRLLIPAMKAMTGMGAREWLCEYLRMAACELLENTDKPISEVGKALGFPSGSAFSQFFLRIQECQPYEWRMLKTTGNMISYHHD